MLLGDLLLPKQYLFCKFCLFNLVILRQLLKATVIEFARYIVLVNSLEQAVKFFNPALCLCKLSAFSSHLFFVFFLVFGAQLFAE